MKQVKLKERLENTVEAFFDSREIDGALAMNVGNKSSLIGDETQSNSYEKGESLIRVLKQAFFFFPGTFILFFISMGTMLDVIYFRSHPEIVLNRSTVMNFQIFLIYLTGFVAIFMTWFGLGDLKNRKHIAIPASIIASGATIGGVIGVTVEVIKFSEQILRDFGFAILFFPIGLIVPFIAKSWVDTQEVSQ